MSVSKERKIFECFGTHVELHSADDTPDRSFAKILLKLSCRRPYCSVVTVTADGSSGQMVDSFSRLDSIKISLQSNEELKHKLSEMR